MCTLVPLQLDPFPCTHPSHTQVHIAAVIPDPATEKTTEVGVAGSLGSGYTEPESGADKLKRRVRGRRMMGGFPVPAKE